MAGKGNFTYKMQQWMQGRNGSDDLGRASMWFAVLLMVVNIIVSFFNISVASVISWFALAFIIYSFFRMASKNLTARENENRAWVKKWTCVAVPVRRFAAYLREWRIYHKEYHVYRCKNCGQNLRVPKGKGKIKVTCPKCKSTFIKKS
jgi:predicted Zn-ribbon and HTH transcriptional regulator